MYRGTNMQKLTPIKSMKTRKIKQMTISDKKGTQAKNLNKLMG